MAPLNEETGKASVQRGQNIPTKNQQIQKAEKSHTEHQIYALKKPSGVTVSSILFNKRLYD